MKPRSSNNNQDVVDDPCWGDPDHCTLEYLLTLLDRNRTILHESKDYVLMNKPADLRMDGEFPSTVHKLITYWYPPPTLQKQSLSNKNVQQLLQQISKLHRHSETPDKQLQVRPCHQLDYATSGVLLLARNTSAAAHASAAFEQRRVEKTYLAVLHGHVKAATKDRPDRPVIPAERVTQFLQQQEDHYKRQQHKKRRPAKANSFPGFQPANAFHQIWQGRYARKVGTGKRKRERLSQEQWDQVDKAMGLNDNECAKLSTLAWKEIKADSTMKDALKRATDSYNGFLKELLDQERSQEETQEQEETTLPSLFCVEGDDPNVFYIYLSLAQVEEEFAMCIADNTPNAPSWIPRGDPNNTQLNFKVALTQCTILNNEATLNNGQCKYPVTKVKLKPRTGRRHQLRVHTAFLGHAIVGDQTYEEEDKSHANLSPRMCLHAHELGFPLPDDEKKKEDLLRATAPDPFPVSEQGELTVSSM